MPGTLIQINRFVKPAAVFERLQRLIPVNSLRSVFGETVSHLAACSIGQTETAPPALPNEYTYEP